MREGEEQREATDEPNVAQRKLVLLGLIAASLPLPRTAAVARWAG